MQLRPPQESERPGGTRRRTGTVADGGSPGATGLKVAFVSPGSQRTAGSGATYYMAQQLRDTCSELIDMPSPNPRPSPVRRAVWNIYRRRTGHAVRWKSTRAYAVAAARGLRDRLAENRPDLIFGALAGWDLALLDAPVPIINCTDSTFPLAVRMGGYPMIDRMSERDLERAVQLEGDMARRCALHVVATRWAAESLHRDYSIPRGRIHVVPWGANLDLSEIPLASEVVRTSPGETCRLLMVGVHWQRKGGDIAFETLAQLRDFGVPAELVVVGCDPPAEYGHERMIAVGRLNKTKAEDREALREHFTRSDFLLLPTRVDTFGHVFCEAGAFGLPSITTQVGGVGEVVRDGENGFALPLEATGSDYAGLIADIWRNKDRYHALSVGSRCAFDQRLNWNAWGRGVERAMDQWMSDQAK